MSCSNPVNIINKTLFYRPGKDKMFLTVPCNHCESCRRNKIDEWAVRIYYETKRVSNLGGCSLFLTFTYNNDNVPLFIYESDGRHYRIPGFNHDHVKLFMKKIRMYLFRTYQMQDVKFIWTSEYGSNTQRPHYHTIFHLPGTVDISRFVSKCRQYWNYGFIYPRSRNPYECVIRSWKDCSNYTSKYITKDLDFYERKDLKDFLYGPGVRQRLLKYDVNGDIIGIEYGDIVQDKFEYRLQLIKNYLPKHWQSKGYGLLLFDEIMNSKNFEKYFKSGVKIPGDDFPHKLPNYIYDKLVYQYKYFADKLYDSFKDTPKELREDAKKVRALTSFGKLLKKRMFEFNIDRLSKDYRQFLSLPGIRQYLKHDEVLYHFGFESRAALSVHINQLLNFRSFDALAHYQLTYRDYRCDEASRKLTLNDLLENSQDIYNKRFSVDTFSLIPYEEAIYKFEGDKVFHPFYHTYNSHPAFKGFDEILNIHFHLKAIFNQKKNDHISHNLRNIARIHQKFNEFHDYDNSPFV